MGKKEITVESLKKGAESLGLKPKAIKDVESGTEIITNFLEGEGAELEYDCEACGKDIPDVDICPYCATTFDGEGGDDAGADKGGEASGEETEATGGDDAGGDDNGGDDDPPKPTKKDGGKKDVAKNKGKGKAKPKAKAKATVDSAEGDKMRDSLIALLEKQPLVKKEVAYLKAGTSRTSFWGPKGLIAKIFSAKGVCWMYMKEAEKNLVKLGASKLHVKTLEAEIKGLGTRYDLPSISEVKGAVKALIGIAEKHETEAAKEEKAAPKKEKKPAKKDAKKKTAKKGGKKKTAKKKK